MLKFLFLDALFGAAVLTQTLAALNALRSLWNWRLAAEFEPVLAFYQANIAPVTRFPVQFVFGEQPGWYGDAYVIAVVWGFLFFIRQAWRAMSPHNDASGAPAATEDTSRVERLVDAVFPAVFCAVLAVALAFTLLPLITPFIALILAAKALAGRRSWFEVSRAYSWNVALVLGLTALGLGLSR